MQAQHDTGRLAIPETSPRFLGKYRLIGSLGQGGMAQVELALVTGPARINKLTVLKVLRDDLTSDRDALTQLFVAEARLAARFCHPNLVQTYEAAELDGRYVLAMEYLDGQTYQTVQTRMVKRGERLPLHAHLRILASVARGLHYAHTLEDFDGQPLRVVHRDLSPHNVFVCYDGQVKLIDFGIAITRDALPTERDVLKGRLDYMAPEQLQNGRLDARTDVFALGVMLWEAIAGVRFAGGSAVCDADKVKVRLHRLEPALGHICPHVPKPLLDLTEYALMRDPVWRLDSAERFADTLDAYLEQRGLPTSAAALSQLVKPAFERERHKRRALIEQHTSVQLTTSGASLPPEPEPVSTTPDARARPRQTAVWLLLALAAAAGGALAWYRPGTSDGAPVEAASAAVPARSRGPASLLLTSTGQGAASAPSHLPSELDAHTQEPELDELGAVLPRRSRAGAGSAAEGLRDEAMRRTLRRNPRSKPALEHASGTRKPPPR